MSLLILVILCNYISLLTILYFLWRSNSIWQNSCWIFYLVWVLLRTYQIIYIPILVFIVLLNGDWSRLYFFGAFYFSSYSLSPPWKIVCSIIYLKTSCLKISLSVVLIECFFVFLILSSYHYVSKIINQKCFYQFILLMYKSYFAKCFILFNNLITVWLVIILHH